MDSSVFLNFLEAVLVIAPPAILGVVLHEISHGYVAFLRGDDTAARMGRLTLNPLAHIHWFGTIVMPLLLYLLSTMMGFKFLFGFAKPVPVDFGRLHDPKRDMVWVAAAGPFTNMALAVASSAAYKTLAMFYPEAYTQTFMSAHGSDSWTLNVLFLMLTFSVYINAILALINLIPVPPADGGRILVGLLPEKQALMYAKIEPYGLPILLFLLLFNPFHIINWTLLPLLNSILEILLYP